MKRGLDLLLGTVALILFSPLLLLISCWIKLDSKGPVIFRQQRVGRGETVFEILKFRTMVINAETTGPKVTAGGDRRVTRAGYWLRRFKLDELLQLVNVIKGDMSLVGPRPEVAEYVEHYPEDIRRRIFELRPGITDLASLEYRHEEALLAAADNPVDTYVHEILPKKLAYCMEYAERQSIGLDVVILLRTCLAVFR